MKISEELVLDSLDKIINGSSIDEKMARRYLIENQDKTIIYLCDSLPNLTDKEQWNIIRILTVMNDKRAIPVLIYCLHRSNNAIVSAAAQLLGKLGGDESYLALIEALEVCLRNENTQVMINLVKALGDLGNPKGAQKITQVMHETSSNVVRYTAIIALMQIGIEHVTEDISKYIENEDHHVRTYAIKALKAHQELYADPPSFVNS